MHTLIVQQHFSNELKFLQHSSEYYAYGATGKTEAEMEGLS